MDGYINQEEELHLKQYRMTHDSVKKLVCKLAVPTIISMMITTIYNMADAYFVGKLNSNSATGAVGVVFSLMSIIQAIGFFFGHGSGNYISKQLGKENNDEASSMAATGFVYSFLGGIFITVIGILFLEPIAKILGSTPTILPYAKDYMLYILLGAPFMTSSLVMNNQLRFQGRAKYAMFGITTGGVLNILLDPLFIFTFNLGIKGAAIATVLSQLIGFIILFIGCKRKGNISIKILKCRFCMKFVKEIVKGGTPSLCRQGLQSVSNVCLNLMAGTYGDPAIAAMTIVIKIMGFANSVVIGFGQGFQPVCGFNYGAKKYERVKEAFYFCVKFSSVFLIFISAIAYIFSPQLIELFQKGDEYVANIGAFALRMQLLTLPLTGWITMCNMMMQNIGKVVKASILAAARQGLFFIPLIFVLPILFDFTGVVIAQPIADILTFILSIPLQILVLKEINRQISFRSLEEEKIKSKNE